MNPTRDIVVEQPRKQYLTVGYELMEPQINKKPMNANICVQYCKKVQVSGNSWLAPYFEPLGSISCKCSETRSHLTVYLSIKGKCFVVHTSVSYLREHSRHWWEYCIAGHIQLATFRQKSSALSYGIRATLNLSDWLQVCQFKHLHFRNCTHAKGNGSTACEIYDELECTSMRLIVGFYSNIILLWVSDYSCACVSQHVF